MLIQYLLLTLLPFNYIIAFWFIFILHFMNLKESTLEIWILILLFPYTATVICVALIIYGITAIILDFIINIFKEKVQEEK